MPNTSATGGYLQPAPAPAPAEGQTLFRFLQQWFVGLSGLDGTMVRPQYQAVLPSIPDDGIGWMSFRITTEDGDRFPYIVHKGDQPDDNGSDELQRHETLNILCSFYDTGDTGNADLLMRLVRDNSAIPQNREVLLPALMQLAYVGDAVVVPVIVKTKWLYQVDLPVLIRRQVVRSYPVLNVLSMVGTLKFDTGAKDKPLAVNPPA
jgi:hypothetical protein